MEELYGGCMRGNIYTKLHAADYYLLTRDRSFLDAHTNIYRPFSNDFVSEMSEHDNLLKPEISGTDIHGRSYASRTASLISAH